MAKLAKNTRSKGYLGRAVCLQCLNFARLVRNCWRIQSGNTGNTTMDRRDFITEARNKAEQEQRDLARDIETDRTARFFSRDTSTWSDLFEGLFLTALMAIVPFLAFAGLALWSFNSLGNDSSAHWVFVFFALAIPVFVLFRALKSKSDVPASVLADMIGGFWTGVFPFLLIGGLAVFGLAAWLGVPVQVALGILIISGILIAAMANQ